MLNFDPAEPARPLAYELNLHPSESIADIERAVEASVLPVRSRLQPDGPFAIAPRIGLSVADELSDPARFDALVALFREHELFPSTVNAFPLGDFQRAEVKTLAYAPPWTTDSRVEATGRIARLSARLFDATAPKERPRRISVSTLGGTYRAWGDDEKTHREMAMRIVEAVALAAEIERDLGIHTPIAFEPEPDTTFETASDVIRFFDHHLAAEAQARLPKRLGLGAHQVEPTLRRYFTVNVDVCHHAVVFSDTAADLRALDTAGLDVTKLHLTSALAVPDPSHPDHLAALREYAEPKYLHQVVGETASGEIRRSADLGETPDAFFEDLREARVHFHVPLSEASLGPLRTTRDEARAALEWDRAARRRYRADPNRDTQKEPGPDLAIETYTWPIIDAANREAGIAEGIAREYEWVIATNAALTN